MTFKLQPQGVPLMHIPTYFNTLEKFNKNIIAALDFTTTDYNPETVYNTLKIFKKNRYEPNDVIVIRYNTVDFYPVGYNVPGIRLFNIFKCIAALDIPIWVICFETNHFGISGQIKILTERVCHDYENLPYILCSHYSENCCPSNIQDTNLDAGAIEFKYMLLAAGVAREHRLSLLSMLAEDNLLDNGLLSWGKFIEEDNNISSQYSHQVISKLWFPYVNSNYQIDETKLKWADSNLSFLATTKEEGILPWRLDPDISAVTMKHQEKFISRYKHPLIDSIPTYNGFYTSNNFVPSMKKSFLYVSAESVFDYPCTVFTEKTFRPIHHKRPFVVFGAPNTLTILRDLYGFKTFGDFWDESYDTETDPNKRFKKAYAVVKQINSLSIDELKQMCNNMKDVIEYNFYHYKNVFLSEEFITQYLIDIETRQNPYV